MLFARLNRVLGSESEELGLVSGLSPEQGLKLKDESINKISCARSAYERFLWDLDWGGLECTNGRTNGGFEDMRI